MRGSWIFKFSKWPPNGKVNTVVNKVKWLFSELESKTQKTITFRFRRRKLWEYLWFRVSSMSYLAEHFNYRCGNVLGASLVIMKLYVQVPNVLNNLSHDRFILALIHLWILYLRLILSLPLTGCIVSVVHSISNSVDWYL